MLPTSFLFLGGGDGLFDADLLRVGFYSVGGGLSHQITLSRLCEYSIIKRPSKRYTLEGGSPKGKGWFDISCRLYNYM